MASFDVNNMYSNIPTSTHPNILSIMYRQQNIPLEKEQGTVTLSNLILQYNFFTHLGRTYLETEGLATGAPT
jgi:hypothetical protein